jgi:hypothetical protein
MTTSKLMLIPCLRCKTRTHPELPSDQWLEADFMAAHVRANFTNEEQLIYNRTLTPVSTTTDTTSVHYEEQDPDVGAEYVAIVP